MYLVKRSFYKERPRTGLNISALALIFKNCLIIIIIKLDLKLLPCKLCVLQMLKERN